MFFITELYYCLRVWPVHRRSSIFLDRVQEQRMVNNKYEISVPLSAFINLFGLCHLHGSALAISGQIVDLRLAVPLHMKTISKDPTFNRIGLELSD